MQSIFSPASRGKREGREETCQDRDGGRKMDWTKPRRRARSMGIEWFGAVDDAGASGAERWPLAWSAALGQGWGPPPQPAAVRVLDSRSIGTRGRTRTPLTRPIRAACGPHEWVRAVEIMTYW